MKFSLTTEAEQNVKMLVKIRDDLSTPPAVRIQAIQVMNKMMEISNITDRKKTTIMNKNIRTLKEIRDDSGIEPSVRVQAINALHKILSERAPVVNEYVLTEEDVMNKIRGVKK